MRQNDKKFFPSCLFVLLFTSALPQDFLLKLWYDKPTGNVWELNAELASKKIQSERTNVMMYQPVGNLLMYFPGHASYKNYYRELNIQNAVSEIK